ncbi:hypothetical protein FSPOR_11467 [Fusarium sporotrichioides]|uniref:Uncharacterized protein n=1 Tax=Fusarium sporotrichioides TaxID=5514 RepID=A0A395RGJ8_FUSSP|nr:hypothetical protein FSPOR_11467 [Fusarium sporotrichioides]
MNMSTSASTTYSTRSRARIDGRNTISPQGYLEIWNLDLVAVGAGTIYLPAILSTREITVDHEAQIQKFIDGPDDSQRLQTETQLVHSVGVSLGQIWASLSDVRAQAPTKIPEPGSNPATPQPKRRKSNTTKEDFVDSGKIQIASSSPISNLSPSPAKSTGYADQDSIHHLPREAYAPEGEYTVELRLQQCMTAEVGATKSITAEDDGGFCIRVSQTRKRIMESTVLFEAKRRQHVLGGIPVVSDDVLAQMTCEAIAARASRHGDDTGDHVFIINGTQQFMRFFQFEITMDYIDDMRKGGTQRRQLNVTSTRWFNIEDRSDRKCIKENICQLLGGTRSKLRDIEIYVKALMKEGRYFILQQDNNSGHGLGKESCVAKWKKDNELKHYFNCLKSLDLAPIKNGGGLLKNKTRRGSMWDDDEIETVARECWDEIDQALIDND